MITAIVQNLQRGVNLLKSIDDTVYDNNSVPPYYSSIGIHMRHVLDVFDCVFEGLDSKNINLVNRKRNELAERRVNHGLGYFEKIINNLEQLNDEDLNLDVKVEDDLGLGVVSANYSLASILIQAHSHAIHHFASIGYIIAQLGIDLPDSDFGYNPTTPRDKEIEV